MVLLVPILMNNHALGGCLVGNDWPNAPCYGCPGCIPSKEKQREEWNPYYQYKGASWMEMMKTQMIEAMKNGTLEDWVNGNQSNYDAWRYYYLNDQAPFFRSSVSGLNDEPHYIPPPLQQLKTGIGSKDVACKLGLDLMIKTNDGLPVCVRYPTANVLLERGWAKETISDMASHDTTIIIPVNSSIKSNGFTFTPSVVKVVIGTNNTVRWINMDSVTNDITSSSISFRSGPIESGYAWTHMFDKSGMYRYYSAIHTWLKGTIIVLSPTTNVNQSEIYTPQSQDPFVPDKDGKVDLSKINLPLTQSGRLNYTKIGYLASENQFKKVLEQQNVKYTSDNFFFLEGLSLLSLPPFTDYCGYVMDDNKIEYWFSSSFHNDTITNYTISKSNPSPCKPGFDSCSCSLQTKIAENNTKDLSYFTASEEENVGEAISHYLDKTGVVNISNQFTVGKYNLQADPSLIHYCGKFTWGKQLEYFDGYLQGSDVMFFELASEKQKLCAINTDAKMFSFEYLDNGTGK